MTLAAHRDVPRHAQAASPPPGAPAHAGAPSAALLVGSVRHVRLAPTFHRFRYPTFCVVLPMRAWAAGRTSPALGRNRFGWLSFHDRDHGHAGGDALAWLEQLLAAHGVTEADGEIWLQTYPRVLGFAFKPVSFWYCERADGQLCAVVAEVNNTFGERHCYVLSGPDVAWGRELRADKALHVSPFFPVRGGYRFRFLRTAATEGAARPARLVARVDYHDAGAPALLTSISGELQPLDRQHVRAALLRMPLLTFGVLARIHWQALRLWLKRVPFFRKPPAPLAASTGAAVGLAARGPAASGGAAEPFHSPPRTA